MLPLLGAAAVVTGLFALIDELFPEEKPVRYYRKKTKKKIFIGFAIEDIRFRDFLVQQSRNKRSPFDFIDMSVKEPWADEVWKRECRKRIRGCDGFIALLSKNSWHSEGARWEIKCAREEGLNIIGMHIKKNDKGAIPPELNGQKIIIWSWENLEKFINK